jgi:thiamine biosynthesis protein ThiI
LASLILVRFGELTLKGNNRQHFEKAVIRDMRNRLRDYPRARMKTSFGRAFIELNGEPFEPIADQLNHVFGLSSFSPVQSCDAEAEAIRETALHVMSQLERIPETFKVSVKRPNKNFPMDTLQMQHYIGGYILPQFPGLKVDVRNPEIELYVEIREKHAYVYCEVYPGLGGFPAGTNGKGMLLLSGGIDSPVAGWMAMKSGLDIEAIHFHSFPFTSERAQQKVLELAQRLSDYSGRITVHMVPFTEIQTRLKQHCDDRLLITMIRRAMMRVANKIAERREAGAMITGESLGQVASQTLPSLTVIGQAASLPVLRPLIMMDKAEIVRLAKRIKTFEISIQPYEDCCTLFVPKSPSTNPNAKIIEKLEESAPWLEALIAEAADSAEVLEISGEKQSHELESLF